MIFWASHQPDLRVSQDDLVDLITRKAAHMVVFGVLAVLLALALRDERMRWPTALVVAWVATLAYAASDEWHQTFVAGRAGQASDVLIDMVGATAALALLQRRMRPAQRRRKKPT